MFAPGEAPRWRFINVLYSPRGGSGVRMVPQPGNCCFYVQKRRPRRPSRQRGNRPETRMPWAFAGD